MSEEDVEQTRRLGDWRESVTELADGEIGPASHLRMLIVAIVASNWVTLQMMLLFVTDLMPAREAVEVSVYFTIVVFAGYFVVSRLPTIATHILRVGGSSGE
jgi:hypothetical protein